MSQIYSGNTKRPELKENQLGILGILSQEFAHFAGNSAGPWVQERVLLGLCMSLRVHPSNLVVQGRVQLEHSNHTIKVVLRLHANTSSPDVY